MKRAKCIFTILLLFLFESKCFELPSFLDSSLIPFYCHFRECCNDKWVINDLDNLRSNMTTFLHGQPLAFKMIYSAIKGHLKVKNPKKALVLSLHGWTGTGKNFVSNLIAENLYKLGPKSQHYRYFNPQLEFQHVSQISDYKDQIKKEIETHVKACPQSLFIFDDLHLMPPGILEVLIPFVDYHPVIKGVDYKNSIFILISNLGGKKIADTAYHLWEEGIPRDSMTMKQFEPFLNFISYNDEGGLKHASLIKNHLVDAFVPFLPLEKHHVKECIKDELRKRGHKIDNELVDNVAEELDYKPKETPIFSSSGCKRISTKIDFLIDS